MQVFFWNSFKILKNLSQNAAIPPIYHHYICKLVYPFLFIIKIVIYLHFAFAARKEDSRFYSVRRQNCDPKYQVKIQ